MRMSTDGHDWITLLVLKPSNKALKWAYLENSIYV